jgi:hypothetical protein
LKAALQEGEIPKWVLRPVALQPPRKENGVRERIVAEEPRATRRELADTEFGLTAPLLEGAAHFYRAGIMKKP